MDVITENIIKSEPAAKLLEMALAEGFKKISPRKLAEWHRYGLLPKPKQYSLGYGKGSIAIYPTGTGQQLIALCTMRANTRNFKVLGWRLWWDGYAVDRKYWQEPLIKAAKNGDRCLSIVKKYAFDDYTDTPELSDRFFDVMDRYAFQRSKLSFWRKIRKRMGKKAIDTIAKYLLQTMAGVFDGNDESQDKDESAISNRILFKALGFRHKTRKIPSNNLNTTELKQALLALSKMMGTHTLSEVARSEESSIRDAQRELISIIHIITPGNNVFEQLVDGPEGLKVFSNIFTSDNIFLQKMILLIFIILKQDAVKNNEIKVFINPEIPSI